MGKYYNIDIRVETSEGYFVGHATTEYDIEQIARLIVAQANAERRFNRGLDRVLKPYV